MVVYFIFRGKEVQFLFLTKTLDGIPVLIQKPKERREREERRRRRRERETERKIKEEEKRKK
jgi:hypothetical protein